VPRPEQLLERQHVQRPARRDRHRVDQLVRRRPMSSSRSGVPC
jgi:hypothetical protein